MKTKILLTLPILIAVFFVTTFFVSADPLGSGAYFWSGSSSSNGAYTGAGFFDASTVDVPSVNGDVTGYAWNGHGYGWLSFNSGDSVGCPTAPCNARREGNDLKGFARLLSVKNEGTNSGGWSGYVELDGVTIDGSGKLGGYAWSPELGFIEFGGGTGVASSLVLKYGSCTGSDVESSFTLNQGLTKQVVACEGATDVTESATWTESGDNVINITGTTPKTITSIASSGTETVTATKGSQSDSVTITGGGALCVPNKCEDSTCEGETCVDNCGDTKTGTKVCNPFGFREVTP